MPYAYATKKLKIPRQLDRRVKLTDDDKKDIQRRYFEHGEAIRAIARVYENTCTRKTIQYLLFPERLETAKKRYKELRADGRYYNKDKHRNYMKKHRHYKQSIKDKLNPPQSPES